MGKEGSSNAFSVTSDFSGLSFETLQSASNAALTLIDVRSTNQISDIIQGVTLNLAGTTSQTETISINRDTSKAKENILAFVAMYSEATSGKVLTDSEEDGP